MVDRSARYILLFLSMVFSLFWVDCYKINTASVLRNSPFYAGIKILQNVENYPPGIRMLPLEIHLQWDPTLTFMIKWNFILKTQRDLNIFSESMYKFSHPQFSERRHGNYFVKFKVIFSHFKFHFTKIPYVLWSRGSTLSFQWYVTRGMYVGVPGEKHPGM